MNLKYYAGSQSGCRSTFSTALAFRTGHRASAPKSSVTRTLKQYLCMFAAILLAIGSPISALSADSPSDPNKLTIEPNKVQLGMTYDVYISRSDGKPFSNLPTVESSAGSGVNVKERHLLNDNKTLIAQVEIRNDATVATTKLRVKYKDENGKDVETTVDLAVIAKQPLKPQPTPNGIDEVDVMWKVVPSKNVSDNFGHKVSKQYYCIEIVIGNNSQYDLQIASVGFRLKARTQEGAKAGAKAGGQIVTNKVPTNSYRMTRATLEKDEQFSTRNVVLGLVKALGPVLTGITPFFHNVNHSNNFSQGINILSNPFEKGIEAVFPDSTIRQLGHLDDQMLRDGLIVHNNLHVRTLAFFPKDFLQLDAADKNNPQKVMEQLGELVLIGDQIAHLNRQVVTATAEGGPVLVPAQTLTRSASFEQGATDKELLIAGSFLDNATIQDKPKGVTISDPAIGSNGRSLSAKVSVDHAAVPGKYVVAITTPGGATPFTLNIEQAPPEATAPDPEDVASDSVKSPQTRAMLKATDMTKQRVVKLTVTGRHLEDAEVVGNTDVQVLEKHNVDGSKLELLLLAPKAAGTYSVDVKNKSSHDDTKTVTFKLK